MGRKRLVIHIGYHKTGSTSVQTYMEENRKLLEERGLFYPVTQRDDRRPYYSKHLHLFNLLIAENHASEGFGDYVREILTPYVQEILASGADTAVISEESFSGMHPDIIRALGVLKEDFDVHVLAIIRRQDEFLQSWYQQSIKDFREQRTFARFINDGDWNRLYYHDTLARWADVFGEDRLTVRSYDQMVSQEGFQMIREFLGLVLGRPVDWDTKERAWNVAFPSVCYEALRYIAREQVADEDYRNFIKTMRRVSLQNPALRQLELFQRKYLTPEISAALHARFGESNRITAERHFGGEDPFPGFSPSEQPGSGIIEDKGHGAFLPREVITALSWMLASTIDG